MGNATAGPLGLDVSTVMRTVHGVYTEACFLLHTHLLCSLCTIIFILSVLFSGYFWRSNRGGIAGRPVSRGREQAEVGKHTYGGGGVYS